jgi:hypothetical protein
MIDCDKTSQLLLIMLCCLLLEVVVCQVVLFFVRNCCILLLHSIVFYHVLLHSAAYALHMFFQSFLLHLLPPCIKNIAEQLEVCFEKLLAASFSLLSLSLSYFFWSLMMQRHQPASLRQSDTAKQDAGEGNREGQSSCTRSKSLRCFFNISVTLLYD